MSVVNGGRHAGKSLPSAALLFLSNRITKDAAPRGRREHRLARRRSRAPKNSFRHRNKKSVYVRCGPAGAEYPCESSTKG